MRALLAVTFLGATALVSTGDQPAVEDPLSCRPAFSAVSATEPFSLVVMLITNDDAFAAIKPPAQAGGEPQVSQWCMPNFQNAYRQALATRPDLKDRCFLQYLPAGTPQQLTGGQDRNQPSRAIVAICNGNYQLLSLVVGVPDADELLTMIEDAQQVQTLIALHGKETAKIRGVIAERSMKRMTRLWRDALKEILAAMDAGDPFGKTLTTTLGRIALTFQEVYLTDVQLRFGLSEAADLTRLVVLEQHLEARRPWCEAMLPFIAGTDFTDTWKPLTEAVWQVTPVAHDADAAELLAWWDTQVEHDSVVLALDPPLLLKQRPWPPVDLGGIADKRGLGWQDLQRLLLELPYRAVDSEQLATLLRDRSLPSLDITVPTRVRYLLFEPDKQLPLVIREGDIPAKPIGRIKRAMKN